MAFTKFIIILEILGYLPSIILIFAVSGVLRLSIPLSLNESLIFPVIFIPIILALGWTRWRIFYSKVTGAPKDEILTAFMKGNLLALPGICLFFFFLFPGGVSFLGYLLLPLTILVGVTQAPIIWFVLRAQIKRLKYEQ